MPFADVFRRACRVLGALLAIPPAYLSAQTRPAVTDSSLVARVLTAEDRRDSLDRAIPDGLANPDARVALIARRALARIRDPRFTARDSLLALPAPPTYAEPAWRLRYRALDPKKTDCAALRSALGDSVWHVRLRAADLITAECASDTISVQTLERWLATASIRTRRTNEAAWQPAAHAMVALARIAPANAKQVLPQLMISELHWVRVYAARAAAILADTQALRTLARDPNDNVKEAAIDALAKLSGHGDVVLYVAALQAKGYQAVRAGARALKGATPTIEMRRALLATALRLRDDRNESSRDARREVMARLGDVADTSMGASLAMFATDFDCGIASAAAALATKLGMATSPICTPFERTLPPDAVRLALGAEFRVRVVMSPASGGGSFTVRLRGDIAPIMAARVLQLVRAHYYDNQAWHRVEPDFVIQGPSPGDNEYVGNERYIRDELGAVPHVRGTIGMSTRGHDTGDGQWFVNLKDNLRLGRDYTVFGEIIDGIDVVDGILEGDMIERVEIIP